MSKNARLVLKAEKALKEKEERGYVSLRSLIADIEKENNQVNKQVNLFTLIKKKIKIKSDSYKSVDDNIDKIKEITQTYLFKLSKSIVKQIDSFNLLGKALTEDEQNKVDKFIDSLDLNDPLFIEAISAGLSVIYASSGDIAVKQLATETATTQTALSPALEAITTDLSANLAVGTSVEQVNTAAVIYAETRAADLVTAINETTRSILRDIIIKALEDGSSVQTIGERIMASTAFNAVRADRIARTEIVNAHIKGNLEAWKLSGNVTKIKWLTANDELTCLTCSMNNNEVVKIGEPFSSGALYPTAHPNCRCDISPVID